jgi:hypothetical protein
VARTWYSIRVELVDGMHAPALWPRPGRILLARPGMTFRMLAAAINAAFARWDLAHLHAFTLADGTRIALRTPWDELDDDALDDTQTKLSRLQLGEQFTFEFDFGDSWMHLCTVAEEKVDPLEVYGEVPERPVAYFGWGAIPDQNGRRWDGDDGSSPVPPPPDPPLSDLPDLHDCWGSRAIPVPPDADAGSSGEDGGELVRGPWLAAVPSPPVSDEPRTPWAYEDVQDLRGAVRRGELDLVIELLRPRDATTVAHLVAPALLDGARTGHEPARLVMRQLLPELGDRGWLGDDELVAELVHALNGGTTELRPTPVDLDELGSHLDGPTDLEEGWVLEVATGRFWPRDPMGMAGEEEPEDFDDPDAFLRVAPLGSRAGYGDMRDFIATVTDERLADRLEVAIQGRGAFRRFGDAVHAAEHWWSVWSTFRSERWLARARWWLAEAGLRPALASDDLD